ncbi:MAG: efflux RND transporter permease subunit [Gammaproteobacteria bacterium]|nr:efflux RND transporter permease subunit [Gammaproteobacteria bacterium]
MNLAEICIKRPVFATVLSLILIAIGIMGFIYLNTRFMPKYARNSVRVTTTYPGASSNLIETSITTPLEKAIGGIQGVKNIQSKSRQGESIIIINLRYGANKYEIANQVRNRVELAKYDLPTNINTPIVQSGWDESDLIDIAFLTSPDKLSQLRDYLERYVVDPIEQIPGVASVEADGVNDYAMRIWLNPDKMKARNLSISDLENAITANNIQLPAGEIKTNTIDYPITAKTRLKTPQQFGNIVIRADNGSLVHLHDVARVALGKTNDTNVVVTINGKPGILLETFPSSDANPIQTAAGVRRFVNSIKSQLPHGVKMQIVYDQSQFTKASIREVYYSIFIAVFCVGLVSFLFLGHLRSTFIPIATIPICLIATFGLMYLFGFTINVITLLAMVLGIGLVVDDAIVVLENIHRHIENKIAPLKAALIGSREITFAIIAMTITLAAVYAPIGLIKSQAAIIFRSFAFTLASAVIISGFVALTLSPMMCAKILTVPKPNPYSNWLERNFKSLEQAYQHFLKWILKHRYIVLGIAVAIGTAGYFLFAGLPKTNMPLEDMGLVMAHVKAPAGTTADWKQKQILAVSKIMRENPNTQYVSSIASDQATGFDIIIDTLKPYAERNQNAQTITADINQGIQQTPGLTARAFTPQFGSSSHNNELQFYIMSSSNYKNLYKTSENLISQLNHFPGINDANSNLNFDSQQYDLTINRALAGSMGVSAQTIDNTIASLIGGKKISTFELGGKNYDVIVQAEKKLVHSLSSINTFYVRNSEQKLVPLSNLVTVTPILTQQNLEHYNRLRAAKIGANITPGYNFGQIVHNLQNELPKLLPANAKFVFTGAAERVFETSHSMGIIFLLAIIFIYLVLSAQFESFFDPLIILLAVPLSMVGALAALKLIDGSVNLYTSIGLVTLIGLIAKHGILITSFANKLKKDGVAIHEALIKAATIRLRPILMTTAAMIFGALPLLLAAGAGAVSRRQIGAVIVGGLLFGTFFSLVLVPVAYSFINQIRNRKNNKNMQINTPNVH